MRLFNEKLGEIDPLSMLLALYDWHSYNGTFFCLW